MALTKIGSIGINTGIAFAGVTTIATLNASDNVLSVGGTVNFVSDVSIGGTVSIAGTLTYEDVTNVDAVGLITARDGIKVGSGITLSVDGDIFATGVTTATKFVGDGSELTGVASTENIRTNTNATFLQNINVSGTVTATSYAGDGSALTGIAATANVRTGILDVAGISTFRNTVNIGAAVTISESGIEATGVGITVANINGGKISGRRNLFINGAMKVAQRGTSITQSSGVGTVDRIIFDYGGIGAHIPQEQADVAAGTTPYTEGFRKAFKITNGNQGGSLPTAGYVTIVYKFEGQDLATSGWNYLSSSSYVTLSFWVKASVAQNYYFRLQTRDGTNYNYPMETGSLTANTWTKITKTIPGNSNLTIANDTGEGAKIEWSMARGTDSTASSVTLNQWAAAADSTLTPDQTANWYTTNSATFELTGIQLEVGPVSTPFEHRSFQQDYLECARYYLQMERLPVMSNRLAGYVSCTSRINPVPMRAIPSLSIAGTISFNSFFYGGGTPTSTTAPGLQNSGDAGAPYDADYFIVNFSGFSTGVFQTNEFGEVFGTTIKLDSEL